MKTGRKNTSSHQLQSAAQSSGKSRGAGMLDLRPASAIQRKYQRDVGEHFIPLQRQENKTGLPDTLKTGIESLSGIAMDDVLVHRNSQKPAQLNAHAYAQGTSIHLGPGEDKHLPHEAWHVVQQKQGRVRPMRQMKGNVPINDDAGLEREADVMGGKAAAFTQLKRVDSHTKEGHQTRVHAVAQLLGDDDIPAAGHHLFNNIFKDFAAALNNALGTITPYIDSIPAANYILKAWNSVRDTIVGKGTTYENTGRGIDLRVYKHLGRPKGMEDTNSVLHGLMKDYFTAEFGNAALRALMVSGEPSKEATRIQQIWKELVGQAVDEQALADYRSDVRKDQGKLTSAEAERAAFLIEGGKYIESFFYNIYRLKSAPEYREVVGEGEAPAEAQAYEEPEAVSGVIDSLTEGDVSGIPTNKAYPGKGFQIPIGAEDGKSKVVRSEIISTYLRSNGWSQKGKTFESPLSQKHFDFHLSTWEKAGATIIEFSLRPVQEDRARSQTFRWFYKFYGTKPAMKMAFDGHGGQSDNLLHSLGSEHVGEAWRRFMEFSGVKVSEYIRGVVKGITAAANK